MEVLHGITGVFAPELLMYCFAGCLLGTLVGVLPGLGPAATMAILLPVTMNLQNPTGAVIMLAGLYYGAAYGGSTVSILTNIPGETSSIPTCFDGFPMTKAGRAGEALWIAAVGSFIAGTIGVLVLSVIGPGLAKYAVRFGPPEYFGLLAFSLVAVVSLSGGSLIKGTAVAVLGMLLATVGADTVSGAFRFSYGLPSLSRGLDLIPIAVGLFGIAEILLNCEAGLTKIYEGKMGRMVPRGAELRKGLVASFRGTAVGLPLGMLPGMTPPVASFMAYDLEKRLSKHPQKFGTGVIEGVAAPEAANNANAQSGFVPLLVFGIPTGPSMALILAALMIHGLQPGPLLFTTKPEFTWAVIGSMYVGNVMLLVLNLPLVGLWARIATVPYKYLGPVILGVCIIAAYSARNTMFDVWVAISCGVAGYFLKRAQWPIAPLILGFILGPLIEVALNQSLNMGGAAIFLSHPVAAGLVGLALAIALGSVAMRRWMPKRVMQESHTSQ